MPDKSKEKDNLCTACQDCCSHHKNTPRSESSNRQLQNRLNRMIGQLNGIKKCWMTIVTAEISSPRSLHVESALQSFGYIILQDHMETCVVEEIKNGNLQIVDEAVDLIKKLK